MAIIQEAFEGLYPERVYDLDASIKYSDHFKAYNANVKYSHDRKKIEFHFSRKWKTVDREITIGLVQELMLKIFHNKKKSLNIDLYHSFIKNLHLAASKKHANPVLEASFMRVNKKYFDDLIEQPNLLFKGDSRRRMATYEYQTDSVVFSDILEDAPSELIDYIMYHELLHKKLKFYGKNGRTYHHTHEFRNKEKAFENNSEIESQLHDFIASKRKRKGFSFLR